VSGTGPTPAKVTRTSTPVDRQREAASRMVLAPFAAASRRRKTLRMAKRPDVGCHSGAAKRAQYFAAGTAGGRIRALPVLANAPALKEEMVTRWASLRRHHHL